MKKSNIITAAVCAVILSVFTVTNGLAATGTSGITYNSQGVIKFEGTDGAQDVIFDARDFETIDKMVTTGKKSIAASVKELTGNTPADLEFATLASEIKNIPSDMSTNGDLGDATTAGVLKGMTFTSSAGIKKAGTMESYVGTTQAASSIQNDTSKQNILVTIPASGYFDTSSEISIPVNTLNRNLGESISPGNATADKLLVNNTAWVNGEEINGTMPNKGGTTTTATTVSESGDNALITIPAKGYYDTTSQISIPVETLKNEVSSLNSSLIIKEALEGATTYNLSFTAVKDGAMIVYAHAYASGAAAGESAYCSMQLVDLTAGKNLTSYFSSSSNVSYIFAVQKGHTYSYKISKGSSNSEGTGSSLSAEYHYQATATVFYAD